MVSQDDIAKYVAHPDIIFATMGKKEGMKLIKKIVVHAKKQRKGYEDHSN